MENCGFFLIDKPKHVNSFYVVRSLRKVLNMKRIGYAGTLDPLASGLMIVAVGEATKLLFDLEQTDKVYEVAIKLGEVSETYDAEGPIHAFKDREISEIINPPSRKQIEEILKKDFSGEQMQIPPRYSAVKIQGKHAYELARKGKEVNIPSKKVVFYDIQIFSYEYPFLRCSVHCSAGTYIRSFAHDLGQKLDCGGYVQELRRTKIGPHLVDDAIELQAFNPQNFQKFFQPPEKFLSDWRHYELTEKEYAFLQNGGFVPNRWELERYEYSKPVLGLFKGKTVGLLEFCEDGRSVKFAKKFNLS